MGNKHTGRYPLILWDSGGGGGDPSSRVNANTEVGGEGRRGRVKR